MEKHVTKYTRLDHVTLIVLILLGLAIAGGGAFDSASTTQRGREGLAGAPTPQIQAASLVVTVLDGAAAPLSGVVVRMYPDAGAQRVRSAVTGHDGVARIAYTYSTAFTGHVCAEGDPQWACKPVSFPLHGPTFVPLTIPVTLHLFAAQPQR